MNRKQREQIVEGRIDLDTNKLDSILNIQNELQRVTSEMSAQQLMTPEAERAVAQVRQLLKQGQFLAAHNALYELQRLYADLGAPIYKPVIKRGLQFKGRGKGPDQVSQAIDRAIADIGILSSADKIWLEINKHSPDLLKGMSDQSFANRVSARKKIVRKKNSD